MRTRMWLISVPLLASAFAAVAAGCGDDTTGAAPPAEGGASSSSGGGSGSSSGMKMDSSTTDAPKEAAKEAAAACVDAAINVATFDSGSPSWACYQQNCATGPGNLPACAADCNCNNLFLTALQCVAEGGATMACFTPPVTMGGDAGLQWYMSCVMNNPATANCQGGDGGGDGEAGPLPDSGDSGDTGTNPDAADAGG